MPDEPEPPRKFYKLKEAEFVRVNPTPENPGTPAPEQEVHAILRDNLARSHAAGLNELAPQARRSSRRKRDYWLLFVIGNGFFGGALFHFGVKSVPGIFALSGVVLFSCGITWVMWVLMDDY